MLLPPDFLLEGNFYLVGIIKMDLFTVFRNSLMKMIGMSVFI
jgi:hypothetical protein